MKKLYYTFGVVFICFFVFSLNCSADSDYVYDVNIYDSYLSTPVLVDSSVSVFNYFDEMKNNTMFYQMLVNYGDSFPLYLSSLTSFTGSTTDTFNFISLFSPGELFNDDYYYVRRYYCSSKLGYGFKVVNLSLNFSPTCDYVQYKFSSDASFISGEVFKSSNSLNSLHPDSKLSKYYFSFAWDISLFSKTYSGTNFGYFLSKFYYLSKPLGFSDNSISVSLNLLHFVYDGHSYDDYDGLNDFGLSYLITNPLISTDYPYIGFLDMLFYDKGSVVIPDNYVSVNYDLSNPISLFPVSSCTHKDYVLYSYSNGFDYFNIYLHSISENDTLGYQASYYSTYEYLGSNILSINPLYKVFDIYSNVVNSFDDTYFNKYYYRFQVKNNKYSNVVYYNPDCYVISSSYEDVTFTNSLTGNDITFTGESVGTNWSDPENIGASNSIDFTDIDTASLIGNLKDGAGSIVEASSSIVYLSSDLFDSLPSEVKTLIIAVFTIFIILIILKFVVTLL